MSKSFNGVSEDLEVSYHSNYLLVVELAIMLPNVLIKMNMKRERNMQKVIENKVSIKGVTIRMKIVMVYLIVMKMKLNKIINYSWLMTMMIFGCLRRGRIS